MRLSAGSTLAVATAMLMVGISPAWASKPIGAPAFAADCNDDGRVHVVGVMNVHGGEGELVQDCDVTMAPHSLLSFRDATLTSGCCHLVVGSVAPGAEHHSRIRLLRTTIDLGDAVQLAPGCCAGQGEPGRSEANGDIEVTDSFVRGTSVEISGSIADHRGKAFVHRSTLEATGPPFPSDFPLVVVASLTGTGGRAFVQDSTLISPTGARIETGETGHTKAHRNVFVAAVTVISAGPGGTCQSSGNTPPVACT